ncbi:MAG: hypothetical protein K0S61_131 [Anaerocolumna sp.]|nr:hypothetical protein [Anaerocolumna sp.]
MEKYLSIKVVEARPMSRGEYHKFKGSTITKNENPDDEGMLVRYSDGYVSWCPKSNFIDSCKRIDDLTFGLALEALKKGFKVARKGWNGKNMFVVYQKAYPNGIPCNEQTAIAWGLNRGDLFRCEPYLQIKMVNGSHSMWVPSINDCLAEDWIILE